MKATEAKLLDFLKKSPQVVIPIYQRPLADPVQETLATRIYTTLNQIAGKMQMSRANARRMVFTYPATIIEETLKHMTAPLVTRRIHNPTGFFRMMVKSTMRSISSQFG